MSANGRLKKLEACFPPPPPEWQAAVRDREHGIGLQPEEFRLYLSVLYEESPGYKPRTVAWQSAGTPEDEEMVAAYRKFLALVYRATYPPLAGAAKQALHDELIAFGLGHLLGDPAANNGDGEGTALSEKT
jgi:hypothetical protein